MPQRNKPAPKKKKAPAHQFSFQLSLNGIAGIAVVAFCLFLWVFLVGIWAGQTIIYPHSSNSSSPATNSESIEAVFAEVVLADAAPARILLRPRERKKRVAPLGRESSPTGDP